MIMRPHFLTADMGISGANFLVAETGTTMIVTNEGNGRMTTTLPRVHVAIAGIEKVLPTLEDVSFILRLLTRSATGQSISNYLTFTTGPKQPGDQDGPEEFHIIIVDAGPHQGAWLGPARSAALHPLRRLHEPLPGVPEHRRPPLRLGLPRTDRLGAHASIRRARECSGPAQRRHAVQPMRRGLPREDPAARSDAQAAGAAGRAGAPSLAASGWGSGSGRGQPRAPASIALARIAARLGRWAGGRDGLIHNLPGRRRLDARPRPARTQGKTFRELYAARRAQKGDRVDAASEPIAPVEDAKYARKTKGSACRETDAVSRRTRATIEDHRMSARDNILGRIRAALGRSAADRGQHSAAMREKLRRPPARSAAEHELGAGCALPRALRVLSSTVDEVGHLDDVPAAVAAICGTDLPRGASAGPSSRALDWRAPGSTSKRGRPTGEDKVGITGSYCAIAETGTLMLLSGPTPTLDQPAARDPYRPGPGLAHSALHGGWLGFAAQGARRLPRQVAFVSGPSRTADIEMTLVLGIHGPYRVHIILVGS